MIQLWDDGDGDYVTITSAALVTDYCSIDVVVDGGEAEASGNSIAKIGGTAYVNVTPGDGYVVTGATAVDENGNEITVTPTDASYTSFSFTMADSDVTVTVNVISTADFTTIASESGQCWSLSQGLLNSAFVDFDDENLYLKIEYVLTGDTDSYGEIQYSTDFENCVHLTNVPCNDYGVTYISIKTLAETASALGYDGYYLFGADLGSFDMDQSVVSIVTAGEYTTTTEVGEVVTIDGTEYEVVWDTIEVNPDGVAYGYHNIIGWSDYAMHANWWSVREGFISALLDHLDDGSLIAIEGNEQTGKWLVLYDSSTYNAWEVPAGNTYSSDGTTVYISIDEIVEKAEENDWEVTQEYINAISNDAQENTVITAVRILTPHEYEVDSWTWSEDYSSATLKLVCTEGTHTEYVTATVTPETTDATCTEDGQIVYNAVAAAEDGNIYTDSVTVVLPATGHTYEAVVTDPTCEEDGYTTYTCVDCGDTYTDDATAAIGHSYGEPEWTWDGYTSATATFTCENDSTHVVTITVTGDDIIDVTTEPTCEEEGETVHSALVTFNGETYSNAVYEVLEPTGHDWSVEYSWSEDGSSCTATHICANDETHNVTATATITSATKTDATCEEMGTTTYTATFTEDWAETQTLDVVDIEATGHDWSVEYSWSEDGSSCTATHVCANDASHNVTASATVTSQVTLEATCETDGQTTYTATFDVDWAESQETTLTDIEATGHDWSVEYSWSEDGSSCTATHICANDETHNVTATATITSATKIAATCEEMGTTTYTATFTEDWAESQTLDVVDIEATGHDWSVEYSWSEDGSSCTATHVCANDASHNVTASATVSSQVTLEATCETDGQTTYTATFDVDWAESQETTLTDIEATGHDWSVEYSWSEDGSSCTATHICANDETHNVTVSATITSATKTDATCEEMGTTTYTATFTEDWAETQTLDVVDIEATGHDWSVEYSWSEDGSSCTATHVCANDASHNVTVSATITSATKTAATCTEKGTTTYTATFDADWAETQTLDVQDIDATGHTYGDPTFTWDEEACTATATFSCTVDGCDGSTTVTADVTSVTTDATCTEDGKTVYTAVVTFNETEYTDTYEVTIPATGHTTEIQGYAAATCTEDGYTGDEVCTVCGETVTVGETIPAAHSYDENGVCTVCGAKMDDSTETGNPLVTVESEDVIFASVLPSGLVTDVTVKLDVDGGTVVVSKVIEDDSNPHLVEHIADTLSFTLYNEEQGDDLVKDTNSFTITDTVNNQTVLRKASILFYGDIAYTGTSAPVSMTFTSNVSLAGYDIYVLHYTGTGVVWEVITNTATISGMTVTVDFTATSFSPYVVIAVSSVSSSSGGSSSHTTDLLLRIPANYAEVNDAIARASALDPADYEDFTAVTDAINAVNWDLKALYQSVVSGYADAINAAIDGLVKVTTEEVIEVVDPIEDTDTDTEVDETEPESEPEASEEANPTTGLMLSLIPMAIAAMAAVSTKRK